MREFEYLSHTADVRIRLEAGSLAELFEIGAQSINELMKPGFCNNQVNYSIHHQFTVKSIDVTSLLIDFLSDILTLSHTEKALFCSFSFAFRDQFLLEVIAQGNKVDSFEEDVKAITYHEADVHRNEKGNWESLLVIDI